MPPLPGVLDADRTVAWRELRFLEMGCTPDEAARLAARPWHQVDVHEFARLIDGGCSAELAAQILT